MVIPPAWGLKLSVLGRAVGDADRKLVGGTVRAVRLPARPVPAALGRSGGVPASIDSMRRRDRCRIH